MSPAPNKLEYLEANCIYHVYNRANGSELMFRSEANNSYFMQQYMKFIHPIAHTFCYCLMPNHFHVLIRIRDEESIRSHFLERAIDKFNGNHITETLDSEGLSQFLTLQFSHFFNSYTQAFNKMHMRRGSLFMRPYKRIAVTDRNYLLTLVKYIHNNPVEAKLTGSAEDWQFSSYKDFFSNAETFIEKNEVIDWFEDLANFSFFHQVEH
jgi:REP element-mobilizing transposase RayT